MAIGRHQVIHECLVADITGGNVDTARMYFLTDADNYGDIASGGGSITGLIAHDGSAWRWLGAAFVDGSGNVGAVNAISGTIASGAIALPAHTLPATWVLTGDTQSAASTDDLDNVTGAASGDILYFRQAGPARDITVKHASGGAGEFHNDTGADVVLADLRGLLHAVYISTNGGEWIVLNSRTS